MFGLTKREQRWKAQEKAAEKLIPMITATLQAAADIRVAEANADAAELERLRAEVKRLQAERETLVARTERCDLEARREPDCRLCRHWRGSHHGYCISVAKCQDSSGFAPTPPIQSWKA